MITDQHIAEDLSRAYIQAVAAKAGVTISPPPSHDYGRDGTFHEIQEVDGRWAETGLPLDFVLKSSKNWSAAQDCIVYDLEMKNYNDLVRRTMEPFAKDCILLLLCLPSEKDAWLAVSEEELILRKCCYWDLIRGDLTPNEKTIRIRISRQQQFTPEALRRLFLKIRGGDLK